MSVILQTLQEHGAIDSGLHWFDEDGPGLLPYTTLTAARRREGSDLGALKGVYEWLESPLIFLVDGEDLKDERDHLRKIRRIVTLRGDAPYLGVVRPGQLEVYRLALDSLPPEECHVSLDEVDQRVTLPWLAHKRPQAAVDSESWISKVVLTLLRQSIRSLRGFDVNGHDAISLAGRALFVRFLADRDLIPESFCPPDEVASLLDDGDRAEATSDWLDETFNGDFLPLSLGIFQKLRKEAYFTLGNILRKAEGGQLYLGWEQKWDYLDFAHIPVGVLSQAYGQHLREYTPKKQQKEGVYYTPRHIADLMVRAAFSGLRSDGEAYRAKILDPAVGAGVFLILALRQLAKERWRETGVRPDTSTLRSILYEQLVGFDINEAALRFAALGLYLMSIELDPHPSPVAKLRFDTKLRDHVLHKVGEGPDIDDPQSDTPIRDLGSLGPRVGPEHEGQYDLVIGNPPWASSTTLPEWSKVKARIAKIASTRLPEGHPPSPLPNEGLDLPFVWRAMEWAKPGGQLAFALHARLLFQQGDKMPEAREALFTAIEVTGVVNGTEIRETKVWPEVRAPFCLLFAKNHQPRPGAAFRYLSPRLEETFNNAGMLRLDAANADIVTVQQVRDRPEIFKILFRGTRLDLEIFERMHSRGLTTIDAYWRKLFGVYRGRPCQAGSGYQNRRDTTEKPESTDWMMETPELVYDNRLPILIKTTDLPLFDKPLLHRARRHEIYRPPLLIVHQSPPANARRIRAAVASGFLIYNVSHYGYSSFGHPDANILIEYVALLIGCKPALWHVLMSSGKFGNERDVIEKLIIDSILLVPLDKLEPNLKKQITQMFQSLVDDDTEENWQKVDTWAAEVYGLRERDLQVISDTLEFNLPFAASKNRAQASPTDAERKTFCESLVEELRPWAEDEGLDIHVTIVSGVPEKSPWGLLQIWTEEPKQGDEGAPSPEEWNEILRIADELASTEVLHPITTQRCLWVARLNQARYWSQSQARLLARRIVWDHLDVLFGEDEA
jgi:hypothetical protein